MRRVVVTGAGGFIGHHLVNRLVSEGCWVRGVDVKPPAFAPSRAHDFMFADLRLSAAALDAVRGADEVFHLAADMGGIGYITTTHADVAHANGLIDANMLHAAMRRHVERYFYSSSACAYPLYRQQEPDSTPLREEDAYPADPERGYGWEKLWAEQLATYFHEDHGLPVRIARFHNCYGPLGTWQGGKEKAPAAICRKVATAIARGWNELEVWGDGRQTRSFIYVDDIVEGILRLASSEHTEPLNLGSEELVSVNELVELVCEVAGVELEVRHDLSAPQGVRGRNSDNDRMREVLGWEPPTTLREGLERTYAWIAEQVGA